MFEKRKCRFEKNSGLRHKEFESRNTRVSEYLMKYGQGKIDSLPQDTRSEVSDPRSENEMLEQGDDFPLGTEELDVLIKLQESAADFEAAFAEIELTKNQRVKFENAMKVLKDENASLDAKRDAYSILDELKSKGKISS